MRKLRIVAALVAFAVVNLSFLNLTGWVPGWCAWIEKIQLIPAVLALNVAVVILWIVLTLLFGRVYCSVICPMGVFQDVVAWLSKRGRGRKNRYSFSPARTWLRYTVLTVFVVCMIAGVAAAAALVEPYGAYGRMVSNLFAPLYGWCNNLLSAISYRLGGYGFVPVDVMFRNVAAIIVALLTLLAIGLLAWRHGRTYCNTICPVGTILGTLSRFSLFKVRIDSEKCKRCRMCEKSCKASCIDLKNSRVDYSRCVDCFDCVDVCKFGAIHYAGGAKYIKGKMMPKDYSESSASMEKQTATSSGQVDSSRRSFLATALTTAALAPLIPLKAQADKAVAAIEGKTRPERKPIVPAGSLGVQHLSRHCVACHLCVTRCPSKVLVPAMNELGLEGFLQPVMSYEMGYCRPQCTVCGDVCPTGAILKVTPEAKANIQIGYAVYLRENCLLNEGKRCGNCVRHCPHEALSLVETEDGGEEISVDTSFCAGCGACEYYCPATPFKAIYVKGYEKHYNINE